MGVKMKNSKILLLNIIIVIMLEKKREREIIQNISIISYGKGSVK
jgi:hypothetical protein